LRSRVHSVRWGQSSSYLVKQHAKLMDDNDDDDESTDSTGGLFYDMTPMQVCHT